MNIPLILWIQFLVTHLFFVGVRYTVALQSGDTALGSFAFEFPGANGDSQGLIFLALAVGSILLGYVLPKLLHKEKPTMAALRPAPVDPKKVPVVLILQLVTAEFASILGMLYSFMRGNPHLLLPFVAMGLLATILYFPSKKQLERLA